MIRQKRKPTHPGAILKRHYLEPLGLSITEVSQRLGVSRKTMSAIVNESASVSVETALRLAKAFDTSPELWLNLQQTFDLWNVAHGTHDWEKVRVFDLAAA
ncbi:MAG: HigA family addiction module antidote protein [Elusimicrobia bacterium]|nr:HigA family addiction module antidote protein [Elusimicrobiota bacterium]